MPFTAVQKKARIMLRAARIAAIRKTAIEDAKGLDAGVFQPLAQSIVDFVAENKDAQVENFRGVFEQLDISHLETDAVERLTWIFASRYLRVRAVVNQALRGDAPAGALARTAEDLAAIETGAMLGFFNLAAEDLPDPVERLLEALGKRLELNLSSEEYYRLGALERTRATTVWGLTEESARRAVMSQLEESLKNGEPMFTAEPGKTSFYSRVKQLVGDRYGTDDDDKVPLAGWHINTIYHTNIATIANRAAMDDAWEMRDVFPYVLYMNPDPVFHACQWLAGKYFPIDDPVVQNFVPPLHFNCDTVVVPVTADELPSGKEGAKAVMKGAQVPPDVQPEFYEGPFREPGIGRAEPFGRWEPPLPLPGAPTGAAPPPPPVLTSFTGQQKANIKITLNALREERKLLIAGRAQAEIGKPDKKKLIRLNARIRDLNEADKLLTDTLKPKPGRIADVEKPFLTKRTRDPGATFERISKTLSDVDARIAQLPERNSGLYAAALDRVNSLRSNLIRDFDTHTMTASQVEEIKTLLIRRIAMGKGFGTEQERLILDSVRFLPLSRLGRALVTADKLKVEITPFLRGTDLTGYVPSRHTIQLMTMRTGKLPADYRARFLGELVKASQYGGPSALPKLEYAAGAKALTGRPELKEWLSKQHENELLRIFGKRAAEEIKAGEYANLFPMLTRSAFSWTTEDGEIIEAPLARRLRLRNLRKRDAWYLLITDFLREF